MRIENLVFENLHCYCCINQTAADRIAYILYPAGISTDWVLRTATEHGISIVIISGIDWDNDLTPWPAPGVPKGSPDFGGRGSLFFSKLTLTVIPNIEKRFNCIINPERTLVGVSLSGLFTLWQWPQSEFFYNIATLSGSFWYHGFEQWIYSHSFSGKRGRCFMLLGEDEPRSRNQLFSAVGKCTDEIVGYIRRHGVDITYRTVPGNHYQYPIERLDMAMSAIYQTNE